MMTRREFLGITSVAAAGAFVSTNTKLFEPRELSGKLKALGNIARVPFQAGLRDDNLPAAFLPSHNVQFLHEANSVPKKNLTIATWNILGAKYRDEVLESFQQLLRDEPQLDYICLQEAPSFLDKTFWRNTVFANFCGVYAPDEFYTNKERVNHTQGNVLLSKHSLDAKIIDLPSVTWERKEKIAKRNAIIARSGTVTIVNTHLDLHASPNDRFEQIKPLLAYCPEQFILGADLNLYGRMGWFSREKTWDTLREKGFVDYLKPVRPWWDFADYLTTNIPCTSNVRSYEGKGSDHPLFVVEFNF